jgi:CRISPR-associated protein (TIGR03984 family)
MSERISDITLKFKNSGLEVKHFSTIEAAVEEASFGSEEETFLLAYSPSRCFLAKWDGNIPNEDIYEFRVFDRSHELRWVKDASSGVGKAVLLRESSDDSAPYFFMPGRYLLWGTVKYRDEQGAVLFEHRIGKIKVPVNCAPGDSVALSYLEYFKTDDYGNLAFFTERLTGLPVLSSNQEQFQMAQGSNEHPLRTLS